MSQSVPGLFAGAACWSVYMFSLVITVLFTEEQQDEPYLACLLELPAGQAKFSLLKAAKLVKSNKPVLILARSQGNSRNALQALPVIKSYTGIFMPVRTHAAKFYSRYQWCIKMP
jgi:hypothetical protein